MVKLEGEVWLELAVVSGGAGFIGSHLCAALLDRDIRVVCLDNLSTGSVRNLATVDRDPRFSFEHVDVSDGPAVQAVLGRSADRPSYFFHLASPASVVDYLRFPIETLRANSLGTWNLLDAATHCGARFLLASTSEIYGDPLVHPQQESYWGNVNPNGVRSCYDESKRFGEALTAQYVRSHGVDGRIVRIFNTYGPHSRIDDGRVVPNFISQALRGQPLTIYGDGMQTRSFCYVSDLVAGILAVIQAPDARGEVFNLGNPREQTVREFAEVVARLCGQAQPQYVQQILPQDDPTRRQPDIGKARSVLGWEPRVELETGLANTIQWFRQVIEGDLAAKHGGETSRVEEHV